MALGVLDGDADPIDEHRVLAIAQWRVLEPAVAVGQALAGGLLDDGPLIEGGTLHEVVEGLVGRRLGGEQEVAAWRPDGIGDRLAGEEVVAEVDGPQMLQALAVRGTASA